MPNLLKKKNNVEMANAKYLRNVHSFTVSKPRYQHAVNIYYCLGSGCETMQNRQTNGTRTTTTTKTLCSQQELIIILHLGYTLMILGAFDRIHSIELK